jgi:hypothetical protein
MADNESTGSREHNGPTTIEAAKEKGKKPSSNGVMDVQRRVMCDMDTKTLPKAQWERT